MFDVPENADGLESTAQRTSGPQSIKNYYLVQPGDWLTTIARQYGFSNWKPIWEHEKNRPLRDKRGSPNLLNPGDILYIPDKDQKAHNPAVSRSNAYHVSGVQDELKLVLRDYDAKPRTSVKWTLRFEGTPIIKQGCTQADGLIKAPVPTGAVEATLLLPDEEAEIKVQLGYLDPITTPRGIQARLAQLGYPVGPIDGVIGERTRAAIYAFQRDYPPLKMDGVCGPKTRVKLRELFGC